MLFGKGWFDHLNLTQGVSASSVNVLPCPSDARIRRAGVQLEVEESRIGRVSEDQASATLMCAE